MGRSSRSVHGDALPLVNGDGEREQRNKRAGGLFDAAYDGTNYAFESVGRVVAGDWPSIRTDRDLFVDFWTYTYFWHLGLGGLYLASLIIQAVIFATSNKFDICVNVTRDTLRGSPLANVVQEVGTPHLFYFTMSATAWMAFWHLYLIAVPGAHRNWYVNVQHEQSGWKFFVRSVAWAVFTIVVAAVVGVTDIFELLLLAGVSGAGEACLGMMDWFNGRMFNDQNGTIESIINVFANSLKLNRNDLLSSIDGVIPIPHVIMVPVWVCGFLWFVAVATIFTFFGSAMHQNESGVHWWVSAVFGIYVFKKAMEVFVSVGYWYIQMWPFRNYVVMEFAQLTGTFIMFSLITYFVLGGGGDSGFGISGGCLY